MNIYGRFVLVLLFLGIIFKLSSVKANVNEAVPGDGSSREICDVRFCDDSSKNGTLRNRLDLFNSEIDSNDQLSGKGQCLNGIHFIKDCEKPILLNEPLQIRAVMSKLRDGKNWAGTYLTGLDRNGQAIGLVIDAREITQEEGQCAFMIEGGLTSFQQIHDFEILVSDTTRAICNQNGEDIMNDRIPDSPARDCDENSLAKNCDFQHVTVTVDEGYMDQDNDGLLDDEDDCPNIPDNENGLNQDEDKDGLADACNDNFLNDSDNDGVSDDIDLCTHIDLHNIELNNCDSAQSQSEDLDNDGLGNACDNDIDGDGLENILDTKPCKLVGIDDLEEDNKGLLDEPENNILPDNQTPQEEPHNESGHFNIDRTNNPSNNIQRNPTNQPENETEKAPSIKGSGSCSVNHNQDNITSQSVFVLLILFMGLQLQIFKLRRKENVSYRK